MGIQKDIDRMMARQRLADVVGDIIGGIFMWGLFIAGSFAISLYKAYVLIDMWHWFAEPAGLPPISFATSIGLCLIVGFVTLNPLAKMNDDGDDDESTSEAVKGLVKLGSIAFWITLCWGSAGVWHYWIL